MPVKNVTELLDNALGNDFNAIEEWITACLQHSLTGPQQQEAQSKLAILEESVDKKIKSQALFLHSVLLYAADKIEKTRANQLLKQAKDLGNTNASYFEVILDVNEGTLTLQDHIMPKLRSSSLREHPLAKIILGDCYCKIKVTRTDRYFAEIAKELYEEAAGEQVAKAYFHLARLQFDQYYLNLSHPEYQKFYNPEEGDRRLKAAIDQKYVPAIIGAIELIKDNVLPPNSLRTLSLDKLYTMARECGDIEVIRLRAELYKGTYQSLYYIPDARIDYEKAVECYKEYSQLKGTEEYNLQIRSLELIVEQLNFIKKDPKMQKLFAAIEEMDHYAHTLKDIDYDKSTALFEKSRDLDNRLTEFLVNSLHLTPSKQDIQQFINEFTSIAHASDSRLEYHREKWKPIAVNIVLCVITAFAFLVPILIKSLINAVGSKRMSINESLFFAHTHSEKLVDKVLELSAVDEMNSVLSQKKQ